MYLSGNPNLDKSDSMFLIPSPHFRQLDIDQDEYIHNCYQLYEKQLLRANLIWPNTNKPLSFRRDSRIHGYPQTFWHIISSGDEAKERSVDFERCRRLHWIREIYDEYTNHYPHQTEEPIKWWKSPRTGHPRYLLATSDFSYVTIYEERKKYTLLTTSYPVLRKRGCERFKKEYDTFWSNQKDKTEAACKQTASDTPSTHGR